jgi:hypothetical protein
MSVQFGFVGGGKAVGYPIGSLGAFVMVATRVHREPHQDRKQRPAGGVALMFTAIPFKRKLKK